MRMLQVSDHRAAVLNVANPVCDADAGLIDRGDGAVLTVAFVDSGADVGITFERPGVPRCRPADPAGSRRPVRPSVLQNHDGA